ncbi:MAG: ammonium transporter [Bacteroidales bacterium]|nr:ammonium transporter [Bacteroidales bacterium]
MEYISIDTLWVLVAAVLVMLMQAGFAMVESGFSRGKNSINILMKNLIDISMGSLIFYIVGYTLMFGVDIGGLIGKPVFFFNDNGVNGIPNKASLIFQTVFAATAATIVSGAIAERTKFSSYIIFTIVITAIIYPIAGHWVWGGGWLSTLSTPFHDFAGSTVVHSVGAWVGLAGAIVLGPRIGKYGKDGKVNVIPGHNLTIGALGVFILWFGWFGFNGGSQLAIGGEENAIAVSSISVNTNLSAAAGVLAAMAVTWWRHKKPGLSLSLNGALAGLVAITAGCDIVTPEASILIGLIAGVTLVFSVELFDKVFRVDDPVGAISVHGVNGALGTILVGFFATEGGLFYGGGVSLLISQFIGVITVGLWAFLLGLALFLILKKTMGVRVTVQEETIGLDITEHGESAYN